MRLPIGKATTILQLLVEGVSIRGCERITGVHRDTISRLMVFSGTKIQRFMHRKIEHLDVKDVQADEMWSYVFKKERNVTSSDKNRKVIGDAYCFVAMERNTKLVLAFHLGKRSQKHTNEFIDRVRNATSLDRYQLTTDGFHPYILAAHTALNDRAHYAQLVKIYAVPNRENTQAIRNTVIGATPQPIFGKPDPKKICTSHVERLNLSTRMGLKRVQRMTNAFSKKWDNLEAAYGLWFGFYNFCRPHSTVRVTPAMESGLAGRIWSIQELLEAA
jgi:IS1 family transposase